MSNDDATRSRVQALVEQLNAVRAVLTAYATGGLGPEEALEEIEEVVSGS